MVESVRGQLKSPFQWAFIRLQPWESTSGVYNLCANKVGFVGECFGTLVCNFESPFQSTLEWCPIYLLWEVTYWPIGFAADTNPNAI